MFSLLSVLLYIVNSIFSGVYTSQFLKGKQTKKIIIILWSIIYFINVLGIKLQPIVTTNG